MSAHVAVDQATATEASKDARQVAAADAKNSSTLARGASDAYRVGVERWLDWQCRMVVGVRSGLVFVPVAKDSDDLRSAGTWPKRDIASDFMLSLAVESFKTGRNLARKARDSGADAAEVNDFVTYVVTHADRPIGVVVFALEIRSEVQRQAVIQLLDWGSVWLEQTLIGMHGERREATSLSLMAIAALAADLPLALAGHRLCNILADNFTCARVGLGTVDGMRIDIVALSHQVQFDRRLANVVALQAAMEECVDQEKTICMPRQLNNAQGLVRAHKRLLDMPETAVACSLPLTVEDKVVGALTLIWENADHVDATAVPLIDDLAKQLAPVLVLKQREDQSVWMHLSSMFRKNAKRLFGAGHLKSKFFAAGLLAFALAGSLIATDLRVAAPSLVEGTTQQAVVAPLAGYLVSADVRAGDEVEEGQVLAVIDDSELLLEQQQWQSEYDKHAKEYQEALGAGDRAAISMASARMAQSKAQLTLVADKIVHTRLRAPFDGILVSGDLSRALGAPLERGQPLFEIVPAGKYRISLKVDERDIASMAQGQHGDLRLASLPDMPIGFVISRIVPLASADQDGNHFRVEAILQEPPEGLRPGMQGIGKVVIGRASLFNAWTRELVGRIRFWLWSVGF